MPGQALAINQADSAAEAELNIRTGYYYAEQNPTTELTAQHPAGYGFLIPTQAQWFTWTLTAADTNLRGLVYTTSERWMLQQVTTRHNHADGTQTCEAVYRLEVEGTAGETVPPPPTTGIVNPLPAIPPIIGLPDLGALPELVVGPNPETLPPFWKETGTTTTGALAIPSVVDVYPAVATCIGAEGSSGTAGAIVILPREAVMEY
jgi:hypothetical protein